MSALVINSTLHDAFNFSCKNSSPLILASLSSTKILTAYFSRSKAEFKPEFPPPATTTVLPPKSGASQVEQYTTPLFSNSFSPGTFSLLGFFRQAVFLNLLFHLTNQLRTGNFFKSGKIFYAFRLQSLPADFFGQNNGVKFFSRGVNTGRQSRSRSADNNKIVNHKV